MHCWNSYHLDVSGSLLLAIPIRKEVVAESHTPLGLGKDDVGKARGSTASVATKVATEACQTGSSSRTPHVATEYGLSVSTKCVTIALDKDAKK